MTSKKQTIKCPICKIPIEYPKGKSLKEIREHNQYFPFCSQRCQFIDLNSWLESDYRIEAGNDPLDEDIE